MSLLDLDAGPAGGVVVVVLTTGHRNHTPDDCRPENLAAWCQGCHLHHDRRHHANTRQQTRAAELAAQMDDLFHPPNEGENR